MKTNARITFLRDLMGWSQRDLAVQSGLAPSSVSRLELGGAQPRRRSLALIAEAFGVPEALLTKQGISPEDLTTALGRGSTVEAPGFPVLTPSQALRLDWNNPSEVHGKGFPRVKGSTAADPDAFLLIAEGAELKTDSDIGSVNGLMLFPNHKPEPPQVVVVRDGDIIGLRFLVRVYGRLALQSTGHEQMPIVYREDLQVFPVGGLVLNVDRRMHRVGVKSEV